MRFFSYVFLIIVLVTTSCKKKLSSSSDFESFVKPAYVLYHTSDDSTYLYFKINTESLLYSRENSSSPFTAKATISCELYTDEKGTSLVQSISKQLIDKAAKRPSKEIIGRIPLQVSPGQQLFLVVKLTDLKRETTWKDVLTLDKSTPYNNQYFLIKDDKGTICFNHHLTGIKKIRVFSNKHETAQFSIKGYKTGKIANLPFSKGYDLNLQTQQDSTFSLGLGELFEMPFIGSYLFTRENKNILELHTLMDGHPHITDRSNFNLPLRYLTTKREYEQIETHIEDREVGEDFWLRIAGNKERARILIKAFYARIKTANNVFTSYKDGWKTDRGMIYTIIGPPNTINYHSSGETWIYGITGNMSSGLSFTFKKPQHPLHLNDFRLKRHGFYEDIWYRAVDAWRKGIVYSYN